MTRGTSAVLALVLFWSSGCQSNSPPPRSPVATASSAPTVNEPSLEIEGGEKPRRFTRSQLLAHPDLESVTLQSPPGFEKHTMHFKAVPLSSLYEGVTVPAGDSLQYHALDGFSATIAAERALNTEAAGSRALVAIEEPAKPWPELGLGKGSPGPFVLIWVHPERSNIGREEWPYQLQSFRVVASPERLYPAMVPAQNLPKHHPARRGYKVFLKNCFACHTFNGQGSSSLGPDLNLPLSPTEYLGEAYLRKLVRDPQSLRTWKGAKMTGFPERDLPEAELDDLVAYLRHMASMRPKTSPDARRTSTPEAPPTP